MLPEPAPQLSVVIPIFNEEENIGALLERLFTVLEALGERFEVLCVDDGSTDRSPQILDAEAVRRPLLGVIHLRANQGQHAAVLAGFRAAAGRWIITLDGDLQNPPEEIPKLVSALDRGHDVVSSYRRRRRDPVLRRAGSRAANFVARRISGMALRDFGCMLRGYSHRVAREVAETSGDSRLFIPALAMRHARNPVEIPVEHDDRAGGDSKYPLGRLLRLTVDLFVSARR